MRIAKRNVSHWNFTADCCLVRRRVGYGDRRIRQGRTADPPKEVNLQVQQFAHPSQPRDLLGRLQLTPLRALAITEVNRINVVVPSRQRRADTRVHPARQAKHSARTRHFGPRLSLRHRQPPTPSARLPSRRRRCPEAAVQPLRPLYEPAAAPEKPAPEDCSRSRPAKSSQSLPPRASPWPSGRSSAQGTCPRSQTCRDLQLVPS